MDCSALSGLLPQIVSGRLSAAATDRIDEHLRACPRCSERVDRARSGLKTPTDRVPVHGAMSGALSIRSSSGAEIPPTVAGGTPGGTLAYGSDTGRVDAEPGPGFVIGHYIIIDEIARGGMGIVYRANQKGMNRVVALKVLPRSAHDDEELVLRFIREARAAAELNHPNVVRVYDIGRDHGLIWYSMELVSGHSLKEIIKTDGRLAPKRAIEVAIGCARALEAAEAHGIVHRDVKPDNLLIDPDGIVKLADLGLVRHEVQRGAGDLTRAGDLLGTPAYMSPEQASDSRHADSKSDLWSLGATLYHALFGVPPFMAKTAMETISRVLNDEVRFPVEYDGLPRELRATVKRLLQKKPADRFQTATDVLKALERCRVELEQKRPVSQRIVTGSEARRILAANPKIHRATSSAEHPAARPRRRRETRKGKFLPVAVLLGAAGIAAPFVLLARGGKTASVDVPQGPVATAPTPAVVSSKQSSPKQTAVAPRPKGYEEVPADLPGDVAVATTQSVVDVSQSSRPSAPAPSEHAAELAALRLLVGSTDVMELAAAAARAERLMADEPEAATVRDALAEQLARVNAVRHDLELEEAVGRAVEPIRRGQTNGFEVARQACTHTIARLDSRVATELTEACDRMQDLLARARKGLTIDARDTFLVKGDRAVTGACQQDGDHWKKDGIYFRFPSEVSLEGLRILALRDKGSQQLARSTAAYALLTNDLNEARKRLLALAKSEKTAVYERLHDVLRSRERNARLPVLVLADMEWSAGQRSVAQQLYHRLVTTPPDVWTPEEKDRAQIRASLVKATAAAPAAGKRVWDFRVKEQVDGLPAEWTEHTAVTLDFLPADRRFMAARLESFDVEQGPAGLELTGAGRILAAPAWNQSELVIEVDAVLSDRMGIGITLGDYVSGMDSVWMVAGYGVRYAPRDKGAVLNLAALFARHDGLWVTTTAFPQLTPLKPVPDEKAVEEIRPGKVSLRLTTKRQEGKIKLVLARVVEGRALPVAEGTLTEHLPAPKAALRAGLVVTGWQDTETVAIERFSVSPR